MKSWAVRRRAFLYILLAGFLLELYLAITGVAIYAAQNPQGGLQGWLDMAYQVVKLFSLRSELTGTINLHLKLARLLAPALLGGATMKGILLILRDEFDKFRLGFWKDHVVVCGLGEKGRRVATDLLAKGERVVVIERTKDHPFADPIRGRKGIVLHGDARDEITLLHAGVQKARQSFILTANDEVNLAIGSSFKQAMALSGSASRTGPLVMNVAIQDPWMNRLFARHPLFTKRDSDLDCRIFNIYEKAAQAILRECPPDQQHPPEGDSRMAHALLVGFGWMGQSLLLHYLKTFHLPNPGASRVTILGDHQDQLHFHKFKEEFRLSPGHPDCPPMPLMRMEERALGTFESGLVESLVESQNGLPVSAVYVCLEKDSDALHAAHLLRKQVGATVPIAICSRNGDISQLVSEIEDSHPKNIRLFNLLDIGCSEVIQVQPHIETLAEGIHQSWLSGLGPQDRGNPNARPWRSLSEPMKDANRMQAAQIHLKIRCAEACLVPEEDPRSVIDFQDQLEELAEMEHRRWMAEKWLAGWSSGPGRDDLKLVHPCLVPWESLPEAEKEKDREAVVRIPALARSLAFKVVSCRMN